MEVVKRKLAELREPDKNVRMHTQTQLREFERSVAMFGQLRPIIIDEKGVIRCGVGLYKTLVRLGWDEADTLQVKGLTENQLKKLMIADNKVYSLGIDDMETLTEFLESLSDDLDVPGYDEDILRTMVADAAQVTETVMEYGQFSPEDVESIQKQGERREAAIQQRQQESLQPPPVAQEPQEAGGPPATPAQAGPATRTITCPHCGKEICL